MKWLKRTSTPKSAKPGVWSKLQKNLGQKLGDILLGRKEIDDALLDELETLLVSSDVGVKTTQRFIEALKRRLSRKSLADGDSVLKALEEDMLTTLTMNHEPSFESSLSHKPFVILMIGINGAGKTTTIGKLAKRHLNLGRSVMLAAGDTFRAAAVEQLQVWGERIQVPVIAQQTGADSASVLYDAYQSAKARGIDVLIADTAGRLHTQGQLMEELKKVKRVMQKIEPTAPHEVMLVLDASIGQNALNQAKQFHEALEVTGITLTKLDGTAKGGILFAIAEELGLPFRYVGVGEAAEDLQPFEPKTFVEAIVHHDRVQAGQ